MKYHLIILLFSLLIGSQSHARMYNPAIGRFLTPDPLGLAGGDTNLYRYANNNPVRFSDPMGTTVLDATTNGGVKQVLGTSDKGAQLYNQLQNSNTLYVFTNKDLGPDTNGTTWFTGPASISINIDPQHGLRPDTLFHEATHGTQFDVGEAPTMSTMTSALMGTLENQAYATENNAYGPLTACRK